MAPKLKLYYFGTTGRAECTRLMLNHAGLDHEDFVVTREHWAELKKQMPYGQIPVLEVDGKKLAQSSAIERYVAQLGNLYPEDRWAASKVEELVAFITEIRDSFIATFHIKDEDARVKARADILSGSLKEQLNKLVDILTANGGKYFVTDKLTWADFSVHDLLSFLGCGFMDGVPPSLLDDYPKLKEHHASIAGLPGVAKFYADVNDGMRLAYKQLP